MLETIELEPKPGKIVAIGCMDEDLDYGKNTIIFGLGGSGISTPDRGLMNLFTPADRSLVQEASPVIYRSLIELSQAMGSTPVYTSHERCGWAGGMGVDPDMVEEETRSLITKIGAPGIRYAGHITHAPAPVRFPNIPLEAALLRPPTEHHHKAHNAILTYDGGITPEEREAFEAKYELGRSFIISADYTKKALAAGLSSQQIKRMITLQLDVAQHIIGEHARLGVHIFGANRLQSDAGVNFEVANQIVEMYKIRAAF